MSADLHDPGGKVRLALFPGVAGAAEFSECGRYRYWLSRSWDIRRLSDGRIGPYVLWIGMNPSTAEASVDDPTIRREMAFTQAMGFNTYLKTNVMDYRATNPKDLFHITPCSDKNLPTIFDIANNRNCAKIVAVWGSLPKQLRCYADAVAKALTHKPLYCLGTNKDGSPRHPLYLARNTPCVRWN